ncbi:RidA family protein [Pelagibius sp. Alg239-R121]|uniref:RidA family protein n=1 Tax=Pelagibius sp. Alg239-R121 TaxID=2993448 RepID=UPI0024A6A277|nr:RidA family protein [Pelagibius sp. Alg239-R121]
MLQGFNPPGTWKPRGRGFSMGVLQHAGQVIHFTGQVAWNEAEEIVGLGDITEQTHQCFRNIDAVLKAVGGCMEDIVSVTTYFTDRSQLPAIQQVRNSYFDPECAPASTSIMAAGLGHPDFLVELAPIAVVPFERFRTAD